MAYGNSLLVLMFYLYWNNLKIFSKIEGKNLNKHKPMLY